MRKIGIGLKRTIVSCLAVVFMAATFLGCGEKSTEDYLVDMEMFSTADGSASIYLDKNWDVEDVGVDFWLCAGNEAGTKVVLLMQFPKDGASIDVSDMEEVQELVKESYGLEEEEQTEVPEIPGMTNLTAGTGTMTVDGSSVDSYVIFGETDYAYYALLFGANNMNDDFIAAANVSCSTFCENAP